MGEIDNPKIFVRKNDSDVEMRPSQMSDVLIFKFVFTCKSEMCFS